MKLFNEKQKSSWAKFCWKIAELLVASVFITGALQGSVSSETKWRSMILIVVFVGFAQIFEGDDMRDDGSKEEEPP